MKGPGLTGFQKHKGSSAAQAPGELYPVSVFCTRSPSLLFACCDRGASAAKSGSRRDDSALSSPPAFPRSPKHRVLLCLPPTRGRAGVAAEGVPPHWSVGCLWSQLPHPPPLHHAAPMGAAVFILQGWHC